MAKIEQLLQQVQENWEDAATLSRLGQELHDRNRLDHAQRVLERALELDPADEDAWSYLSYTHFRSLDDAGGREALERGVAAVGRLPGPIRRPDQWPRRTRWSRTSISIVFPTTSCLSTTTRRLTRARSG